MPITHPELRALERSLGPQPTRAQVANFRSTVMRHLRSEEREESKMAARKKGASKRDKSMELFAQGRSERIAARRAADPERTAKAMERLAKLKQKRERAERIGARRTANPERTARAIERLEQMRMTREIQEREAKASLAGYLRAGRIVARREANPERTAKAKERLARLRARAAAGKKGVSLSRVMANLPESLQGSALAFREQMRVAKRVDEAEKTTIPSLLRKAAEAAARGDRIGANLYRSRAQAMKAEAREFNKSLEKRRASFPRFSSRAATGQAKKLLDEAESLRARAREASARGDKMGANLLRARASELEAQARKVKRAVTKRAKRKTVAKKAAPKKAAKKKAAPKKTTKKKSKSKSPTKRKKTGKRKTKRVTKVVTKVVYKCPPKPKKRKAPKKRAKAREPKEEGRFVPPHAPAVAAGGGVLECTKCKRIHSLREHWSHRLIHGTAKKQHNYKCTRGGYCVFEQIQKKKPATRKKARVAAVKVEKMVGSRNISSIIKQAQQRVANAKFEQKYAG